MINMVVPKEQILDTVELFRYDGSRKLNLRFLAKHVLGMNIQTGNHDSIEDARTALALYRKYLELKEQVRPLRALCTYRHITGLYTHYLPPQHNQGRFEKVLARLYATGHREGFKL